METPEIKLGSKSYKARTPRVKLWRKIVHFNKHYGKLDDFHLNIEAYEAMLDLIAECFNHPEVTPEAIEDHLEINQIVPTFVKVTEWVGSLISAAGSGLPEKN